MIRPFAATALALAATTAGLAAGRTTTTAEVAESLTAGRSPAFATTGDFTAATWCRPDTTPRELDRMFDGDPGGIVGADSPRTVELPDGRVLWLFQDGRFRLGDGSITLVHNFGVVQDGPCFELRLGGSRDAPRSWLLGEHTTPFGRWFWPLAATIGADGAVYVFLAEMLEEGEDYLEVTVPTSVFVAELDPITAEPAWYGAAANPSADLYGWEIASDRHWTYLFAHCHRQFGFDPVRFGVDGHDRGCSGRVTVGRVPRGRVFDAPTYWDGSTWRSDPARAVPLVDFDGERYANPTRFRHVNERWVAVTKVNDWWGDEIVVEEAPRVTGPYERVATLFPATKCGEECNTYFAAFADGVTTPPGRLAVSLSHNRWDGNPTSLYRPTFFTIDAPRDAPALAARCDLGHCG